MKIKNGFVFLETIIVVCVLSLILIALYSSYSYILIKAEERNTFDSTEYLYRAYKIIDFLKNDKELTNREENTFEIGTKFVDGEFKYVQSFGTPTKEELDCLSEVYDFDSIMQVIPKEYLCNTNECKNKLKTAMPSMVDYLKTFDVDDDTSYLFVKFNIPASKINSNKYVILGNEDLKIPYYIKIEVGDIG